MREERFVVEKRRLYFTDYYTYKSDYDFFWPVGIAIVVFFFTFLILLSVNTEDQIYLDVIIVFAFIIFFLGVAAMFCLDGEYYQSRPLPEGIDEENVVWVKPFWVRPGKASLKAAHAAVRINRKPSKKELI